MKRIGYLGPEGTFAERAARTYAERIKITEPVFSPYPSIPETMLAVLQGKVEACVVPVENSLEGSVNITLDMLAHEIDLPIAGEVILSIKHFLLGRPETKNNVRVLVTHPHAFAQCYRYLRENLPDVEVQLVSSTAEAARRVREAPPGWAAIAGEEAGARYGLAVLSPEIQDNPGNKTRFLVLSREPVPATGRDKTSLVLALPEDRPGGLYGILGVFARASINLTRIESRPAKSELGDYIFFLDCMGHAALSPLREVLDDLKGYTVMLKILGSYPCAPGVDC